MPTPTTAFADAAAEYGDVDPEDIEAVQHWFTDELPNLPVDTIEQVLRDLLVQDGAAPARQINPVYPERAPLPSLRSSPAVAAPLLAEEWRRLFSRLLGRLRRG
ncbi:MAG: hypothetical protein WBB95_28720 [Pseudomonas sp.]|uniref:hypothetical protein n=1 Tax=Pseudomonas sp. TaxID=306 RepID=UPI003C79664B